MREWIDRNWNLIFHKKNVWSLTFLDDNPFRYNDIIILSSGTKGRHLGKNWFKTIKS